MERHRMTRRHGKRTTVIAALLALMACDAALAAGMTFEVGHRRDDFHWNIADSDGDPDVLSELTWNLDQMRELRLEGFLTHGKWKLDWHTARATVEEGSNQDSDYLGSGRTDEFIRSNNRGDGKIDDIGIRLGYQFDLDLPAAPGYLKMIPSLGYGRMRQYLVMTDGCQTIPNPDPSVSCTPFPNLQSTYHTSWESMTIGFEVLLGLKASRLGIRWRSEAFVDADYDATANWNLRQALQHPVSFRQHAEGSGVRSSIGLEYVLAAPLVLTATYTTMAMETEQGVDTTYLRDGRAVSTFFNEAVWRSEVYMLGIGARFR